MALKQNTAEGYTNGTTVTAGTSGSTSGDAFGLVSVTTAGSVSASTTQKMHGLVSYKFTESTAANVAFVDWLGYTATAMAGRFYIYFNSFSAATTRLASFRSSVSGNAVSVVLAPPNGSSQSKFNIADAGGNFIASSSSTNPALATATWYRVEWQCQPGADTTSATINLQIFTGDSTTALYTFTTTTGNANTGTMTEARFGKLDNSGAADFYMDDLAVLDGTIAPLGPSGGASVNGLVQGVAATNTGLAPNPSVDGETTVTGGGPASATGRANSAAATSNGASISVVVSVGSGRGFGATAVITTAFTATADPTNNPPRVRLDLGQVTPGSTLTVYRVNTDSSTVAVRSANPAVISGTSALFYDYEAPFNTDVLYSATILGASGTALSTTANLQVTQPWLVHPNIPSQSVPLTVVTPPTRTRTSGRGIFRPLGRADAVTISDGARKAASFELHVRTDNLTDEQALDALLDDDSVLLLQIVYPGQARALYEWVSIADATAAPMLDFWEGNSYDWTLPCDVSSSPTGLVSPQRTLLDVLVEFPSGLQGIDDAYASLRDLVTDTIRS